MVMPVIKSYEITFLLIDFVPNHFSCFTLMSCTQGLPSPRVKFIRPIKGLMVVWSFLGHSLPANSLYHDYSVAVLHENGERTNVITNANCWYCYSARTSLCLQGPPTGT